jgi:hypothetical protein
MSAAVADYHIINFPLSDRLAPASIDFLPYGTRTLKVKVTNPARINQTLVLRSENLPPGFGVDKFYSHEEGGTDFRLSWGGGHEQGACLLGKDSGPLGKIEACAPLVDPPPDRPQDPPTSFVYLNLTHVSGPANISRNMLLTILPEADPTAGALNTLALALNPPVAQDPVRFVRVDETTYTFQGRQLPDYLPRWWSSASVIYPDFGGKFPNLSLTIDGQDLRVFIALKPKPQAGDYKLLAHLHDNIKLQDIDQARDFTAELYHFAKQFFVLRIWFAWLRKADLATALNEIPDAERFDFVIDAQRMRVAYAATDVHWREMWVKSPLNAPVEAQLGLFASDVLKMKQYTPIDTSSAIPYRPTERLKRQLNSGLVIPASAPALAGPEAHVPYFVNGDAIDASSDPRHG